MVYINDICASKSSFDTAWGVRWLTYKSRKWSNGWLSEAWQRSQLEICRGGHPPSKWSKLSKVFFFCMMSKKIYESFFNSKLLSLYVYIHNIYIQYIFICIHICFHLLLGFVWLHGNMITSYLSWIFSFWSSFNSSPTKPDLSPLACARTFVPPCWPLVGGFGHSLLSNTCFGGGFQSPKHKCLENLGKKELLVWWFLWVGNGK